MVKKFGELVLEICLAKKISRLSIYTEGNQGETKGWQIKLE